MLHPTSITAKEIIVVFVSFNSFWNTIELVKKILFRILYLVFYACPLQTYEVARKHYLYHPTLRTYQYASDEVMQLFKQTMNTVSPQ